MNRSEEFMTELQSLLRKYRVSLQIELDYCDYCGVDATLKAYGDASYDHDGDLVEPAINCNLGTFVDHDSPKTLKRT